MNLPTRSEKVMFYVFVSLAFGAWLTATMVMALKGAGV